MATVYTNIFHENLLIKYKNQVQDKCTIAVTMLQRIWMMKIEISHKYNKKPNQPK